MLLGVASFHAFVKPATAPVAAVPIPPATVDNIPPLTRPALLAMLPSVWPVDGKFNLSGAGLYVGGSGGFGGCGGFGEDIIDCGMPGPEAIFSASCMPKSKAFIVALFVIRRFFVVVLRMALAAVTARLVDGAAARAYHFAAQVH
jgi:hypothetical protein